MASEDAPARRQQGLQKALMRAPVWLYRLGLGWLLGRRFLLLNHLGRKSGRRRQAVLEVAAYDRATRTYYVASGWGPRSDWYQNLRSTPEATLQVGVRRLAAQAELLTPEASGQAMVDYAHRYPVVAQRIARFCGYEVDGSDESCFALGRDAVPFVALRVVRRGPSAA